MIGTVEIHNLEVRCIVGIRPWERRTPQLVTLDLAIDVPIDVAARSGRVEDTIDYSAMCELTSRYIVDAEFGLLEALVHDTVNFLKQQYPSARRVAVAVRKPGAVGAASHAGVRAEVNYPVEES